MAPVAHPACGARPILAHPAHASRPHRELHIYGPSGAARMRYAPRFGTPLTRFVAPWGTPP
eukprot:7771545-Pyramimonas_sp.AAC.1